MMRFINCLLVAFILQPMEIDASVNIYPIGENAGNNNFICGEKLVLNCQITSNPLAMTWRNESSLIPIAECISNTCTLNPSVANEYEFSTDTSSGIYNLTFNVTNFNNGTSYECGNGSTSDISLVLVKDFRPAVIESTDKRLQVMSGCISSSVDVAFKWMKLKASNKEESTYDTTCSNEQYSTDTTTCSLDEKCGGSTLVRKLMSIEEDQEGTDYYLKAILSYDGFVVESPFTSNIYKIKGLVIPCKQTQTPFMNSTLKPVDTETSTFQNKNTSLFTKATNVTIKNSQSHSDGVYISLLIGGLSVAFVFIIVLIFFCCKYNRQHE